MNTLNQTKPDNVEVWLNELGLPGADRDYKPGHERVLSLIAALEKAGETFYQPKVRVRVAGTNGKGSTSNFIAAALQANGLKVGLYTSPHIQTFHERISVQGEKIEDKALLTLMEKVMPLALKTKTSYFETATVLALLHFSHKKVDVEILEAGVGAKLDATTAVPADVGLLTSVARDHEAWLGDLIEGIALEKSYVFKGCEVKLSMPQSGEVRAVLNQLNSNIEYSASFTEPLAMMGKYQQFNAGLAYQAVQVIKSLNSTLSESISLAASKKAISKTSVVGRLQFIQFNKHKFWLDAAHNEHAIQKLVDTLSALEMSFDTIILCTRKDRDLSASVPQLKKYSKKIVVMTGEAKHDYQCMSDALSEEVAKLTHGEFLVLGSFVTLGETLNWMQSEQALGE